MRRAALIILFAALLATPALAASPSAEELREYGIPALESAVPDTARDMLDGAGVADALDAPGLFSRMWEALCDKLAGLARGSMRSAAALIAAVLLCSLAGVFAEGEGERWAGLCGVLAVSGIALGDAHSFIGRGSALLFDISAFSKSLLPCLAATAAASGRASAGAAKYAATALFMDVGITASQRLLLPLVYIYVGASIAAAALESEALSSAAKLLKWVCCTATTLIMTAFTAYFSLTGAIAGAADAAAAKAAKTAISAALPVVGGMISDAAGTVLAGASLLRGAVGVYGLCVVCCLCAAPFLALGLQYLLYKAASAVALGFADKRLGSLIAELGGAFGLVLGLVGAAAFMLFFSIISMVKAVVP